MAPPRKTHCKHGHRLDEAGRNTNGKCRECNLRYAREGSARWYAWMDALKLERGCDRCGYATCPAALEFHHRNPAAKLFAVGQHPRMARSRVEAEIAKCDLLCANCHAEEHFTREVTA